VVPDGYTPRAPRLGKATTAELVALLEHPNGWHRDTASRLLYQRRDRSAVESLRQLAAGSKTPAGRVHALYALAGMGALGADLVLAALSDPEPRVREHALRLAEPLADDEPRIQQRMAGMVDDSDPLVRYQLAFSLGALPGTRPAPTLVALAVRDGAEPWARVAVLSSVSGCAGEAFHGLAGNARFRASGHGRTFLTTLAAQISASGRPGDLARVEEALGGPLAANQALAREIVSAMMSQASAAARAKLSGARAGHSGAILEGLLADARKTVLDEQTPEAARAAAVRALRFAAFDDVLSLLAGLIASRQTLDVQTAAVETLASFDDARVATILLRRWPEMSPRLRATAAEALFARPAWIVAFLDAVEGGSVGRADVDVSRLDLLKNYPVSTVRARATKLFVGVRARRQDVAAAYQPALQLKGDRERGKTVFATHCATCHRLEGVGQQVGADLAAVRDRGLDSVLLNILDPNREVKPQFLSYVVVTTSGRVLTGIITGETANSLTVRKPDGGAETLLRLEIDELRSTGLSYMPEGLEKQIDVAAMADLLAYLNSVK
jgi:putative heme-binding domain-containing protein